MSLLRSAGRAYLLNRMMRGGRHGRYGRRAPYGYGYGRRPSRRGSGGFRLFGPFPGYSRRTRRGSRVTVTGCCLPIPFGVSVLGALAARQALRDR